MQRLIDNVSYVLISLLTCFAVACGGGGGGGGGPDDDLPHDAADPIGADREPCDLQLTKKADDNHTTGGPLTYVLRVDNMGDVACRPPVTVSDDLPPGITFSSTSSSDWNCQTTATGPQQLTCTYTNGALPAGDSVDLALTVDVSDEACMASNCASVTNGEGNDSGKGIDETPDNNRDCADTQCKSADGCVDPPAGMVGWWTGDQTAEDNSNADNHGALINGAHYATGQVLESFQFDGQDDHVEVPNDASLNFGADDQFSIDAWIYPEKGQKKVDTILDKRAADADGTPTGYALQLRSNTLIVRTQNGSSGVTYASSTPIPEEAWTHVTVTVDLANDTGTLYIDGAQDGTFSPSSTGAGDLTNDSPLLIGRDHNGKRPFDGRIDEVEIFDRLLDPAEIGGLVKAGPCGKCRVGCFEGTASYSAGVDDDFQNGTDPADPSPYLQNNFGPLEAFDDPGVNQHFAHTFTDLKPDVEHQHICGAELEVRMRPSGSIDHNDGFGIGVSDGNGNLVERWYSRIGGANGFFNGPWSQSQGTGAQTFTFDLANLPPSSSHPTDLITDLDAHEMLNIRMQDDSEVDYAVLTVEYCCDPYEPGEEEPDLAVDKSLEGDLQIGQTSTYSISVENVGDGDASPTTEITDEIPACLEIGGIASPWDQWCNVNGQTVSCQYPDPIAAGSQLQPIEIEVRPTDECGDLAENCATVSHDDDTNADNDESCVESEVSHQRREADLSIDKKAGHDADDTLRRYELTVKNNGPDADPGPITVSDNLNACLQYLGASGSNWNCNFNAPVVTCTHAGPLPSGGSSTVTLNVEPTRACGDKIRNCATVKSMADTDTTNNESCVSSPAF